MQHHEYNPHYSPEQPQTLSQDTAPNLASTQESSRQYPTPFGYLTFDDLYMASCRIVGSTLRDAFHISDPDDVDDCMQVGYFNVWKDLQTTPNLFIDKPKSYVIQAIVLRSKAQRYAHFRHNRKLVYGVEVQQYATENSISTDRLDVWMDIAYAVQQVAEYSLTPDNTLYLYALYTLITQVKTQDVARSSGYGLSTITKAKRQVKATLAELLPNYGNLRDDKTQLIPVSQRRSKNFAQQGSRLISSYFFE